jgi:hypothetical protein
MRDAEKVRLAMSVADQRSEFEEALVRNRKTYPTREFRLFAEAVRPYEKTRSDGMMHRVVTRTVHGLGDNLRVERKQVPGEVLCEAERLECLLFLSYDPHFEGETNLPAFRTTVERSPKARVRVCRFGLMVGRYRQSWLRPADRSPRTGLRGSADFCVLSYRSNASGDGAAQIAWGQSVNRPMVPQLPGTPTGATVYRNSNNRHNAHRPMLRP